MTDDSPPPSPPWWGDYAVDVGETLHWRVGPLEVQVRRRSAEWRVAWRRTDDEDRAPEVSRLEAPEPIDGWTLTRYGFGSTGPDLRMTPCLSNRPVISRPEIAFSIQSEQRITLLLSTPLSLGISTGPDQPLVELPVLRLSDTWFGPNTREGTLCYASRTHLRPVDEPTDLPTWRAQTAVTLHNRGQDPLSLERLSLPIPRLSLFTDGESFWTSPVTLERASGVEANVIIGESSRSGRLIAPPREIEGPNLAVRAFNSLFG